MTSTHFFCAICGAGLSVGAESAGRVIECPACRHSVPVPHPTRGCLPLLPAQVLALDVKFLCAGCGAKLRIDARLEGETLPCPKCARPNAVPRWSTATGAPSRQDATGTQLSAAEIEYLSGPHEIAELRTAAG